jgi:hypothetical protein
LGGSRKREIAAAFIPQIRPSELLGVYRPVRWEDVSDKDGCRERIKSTFEDWDINVSPLSLRRRENYFIRKQG